MQKIKKSFLPLILLMLVVSSCKKETEVVTITDNDAPYYGEIPKVTLQNYINRIYIDLIGREPLDTEMIDEENTFRASGISMASREALITKLLTDTTYMPGDSSYMHAYYNRFYESCKTRVLEAASNDYVAGEIGIVKNGHLQDSLAGDSLAMSLKKIAIENYYNIIYCEADYRNDTIDVKDVFARMLNNGVYDQINMNTFNFINAAFNDLFFRFPTDNEFDASYEMVEYNLPDVVLGQSGQNKGDLINILVNSEEFYEGIIQWVYINLLAREPSTEEVNTIMQTFFDDHDVQKVQMDIMKTDEYANFNQ